MYKQEKNLIVESTVCLCFGSWREVDKFEFIRGSRSRITVLQDKEEKVTVLKIILF